MKGTKASTQPPSCIAVLLLSPYSSSLCRMSIDDMHEYIYKTTAELEADAGLTLEEHKAVQMARIPRHRGKLI